MIIGSLEKAINDKYVEQFHSVSFNFFVFLLKCSVVSILNFYSLLPRIFYCFE